MHVGGREGVIEFIIIIWRGFGGLTPSCMWGEGRSNWVHLLLFGRGSGVSCLHACGGREVVIEFIYYYLEGVRGSHTFMHVGGREGVIEFIYYYLEGVRGSHTFMHVGGGKE